MLDRPIRLKDYDGALRQLTIAELGHEDPTLLLTNQLNRSASLRQEARKRRITSNVKPFIGTLRVTNPARQSWTSNRKRVLRGGG